jgi:hypothetical protein
MFETSKDFLNLSIGISIFGLAAFLCWTIYYFARIMQQFFKVVKEMRDRLGKLDELVKMVKEKIEHSTSYLLLIGEGVKKLVEVIKEHTGKNKEGN